MLLLSKIKGRTVFRVLAYLLGFVLQFFYYEFSIVLLFPVKYSSIIFFTIAYLYTTDRFQPLTFSNKMKIVWIETVVMAVVGLPYFAIIYFASQHGYNLVWLLGF